MADEDPQIAIEKWQALATHGISPSVINPAKGYLANLQSEQSRVTGLSVLRSIATILGFTEVVMSDNGDTTLRPDVESLPWHRIDRSIVQAIREQLKRDGKSPSTVNLYLSVLKGVAREAALNQQMPDNQLSLIEKVASVRGSRLPAGRAMHTNEITSLIDHCLTSEGLAGVRDAALLGVLFGCGPRRAEIVTIDIAKINFANRFVRVIGKGNKERQLEMPPRTMELIQTWLDESGLTYGALFRPINRWGTVTPDRRLTPRGVYDVVTRRVRQAGLEKASPHDLRRSFLTYLLDNNVDLATAADLAGHASTDTTRRYLRGQQKRNRKAADKIDF